MKPIWDLSLRIFHWSLVVIVILDHFLIDGGRGWHAWIGYLACVLIVFRFFHRRKILNTRLPMLGLLYLLALSGWMHSWDRFFGDDWVVDTHVFLSYTLLGLALIHVVDVVKKSFKIRKNLIASMIHGKRSDF
jgi:cytochrome b